MNVFLSVFLDAPIVLEPVDIPGHTLQLLQAADSLFTLKEEEELKPRAWWRSNDERTVYYGMEKTMDVVKDVLSKSKFDVSPGKMLFCGRQI